MGSKKQATVLEEGEVAGVRRALELLENRYARFIDQPEREFFLGLADYLKSISDSTLLEGLTGILIHEEREKDLGEFQKLGNIFLDEIRKTESKVLKIVKAVVQTGAIKESLREMEGIKTGHIISSTPLPLALHDALADVIRAIKDAGHYELIKKYIDLFPDSDLIAGFNLCEAHDAYVRLSKQIEKAKKVSVWGSWDELQKVRRAAYPAIISTPTPRDITRTQQFAGNFYPSAFEGILNGKDRSPYFKQSDFKSHISRVHHFFIENAEQVLNNYSVRGADSDTKGTVKLPEKITSVLLDESGKYFDFNHGHVTIAAPNGRKMFQILWKFWGARSVRGKDGKEQRDNATELTTFFIATQLGYKKPNSAKRQIDRLASDLQKLKVPVSLKHIGSDSYQIVVTLS